MKRSKRILALCTTAILMLSMLAGCGSSTDTSTAGSTQSSNSGDSSVVYDTSKTLEISWLGLGGNNIVDGNPVQKMIEEKFNVKITNTKVDITDTEQLNILLSSGEMPDTAFLYKTVAEMENLDLIRSIPMDMIKQYYPSYAALLDEYPVGWKINHSSVNPDDFACLSGPALYIQNDGYMSFYRLDWLEEAGIELPGELQQLDSEGRLFFCPTSFTLEQQEEIFSNFVTRTASNGGKVYGMTGNKDYAQHSFSSLFATYGVKVFETFGFEEGGKYIYGYQSKKWQEALTKLQDYYAKGFIDPECVSQDLPTSWEKITNGNVGYWSTCVSYVNPAYTDRPPFSVLQKDPEAKIVILPPERKDENAEQNFPTYTDMPHAFNYLTFISRDVDDEKLARILMIYEYLNFDKEASIFARFGEENVDFEWSGEAYNSPAVYINDAATAEGKGAKGLIYYPMVIYDDQMTKYIVPSTEVPLLDWVKARDYTPIVSERYDLLGENTKEYSELSALYKNEFDLVWNSFYMECMLGKKDPVADWDTYLEDLDRAGASQMAEILGKGPLFLPAEKGEVVYSE